MASTVRSLSNHYDILRLKPGASSDEIVEAFAAEMRAARVRPDIPVARLAELSVAYETLRDPAKRRAYDASLELDRVAAPKPDASPTPAESRVAAFIASSLRDPVKPAEVEATPDPVPPSPASVARPQRPAAAPLPDRASNPAEPAGLLIDRRRASIGAGAAGLAILALAVSQPERNVDRIVSPAAPAAAVTVGLPPAEPVQDYVVPPQMSETSAEEPAPAAGPEPRSTLAAAPQEAADAGDRVEAPSPPVAVAEKPADLLAPLNSEASDEPAPAATAAAKPPLPNATIARTIERIGYACGSVASAAAVDAGSGVFKITCSSGDSYRAAPVGGRYHFRRWGRQ